MSDQNEVPKRRRAQKQTQENDQEEQGMGNNDYGYQLVQTISRIEANSKGITKPWITVFIATIVIFVGIVTFGTITFVNTANDMRETYIRNVEEVILSRSNIQAANDWERLPEEQRRAMLREQYFTIVRYYTNTSPEEQRLSDEQILETFNELWRTTEKIPSINFFLPVAYMKVATNFNPMYNSEFRRGVGGFLLREIENTINLPLVQDDPVFRTVYRGSETANNPTEMMRVLVARIDSLMSLFRNREDWVILALFTNEYDVIAQYWNDGEGSIPDEFYREGDLAETLRYYYAFKNWQIPLTEDIDLSETVDIDNG